MDKLGYLNGKNARRHTPRIRKKALVNNFPGKLGYVTKWRLLGPFDNTDRNAIAKGKEFPLKSLDSSVIVKGKRAVWQDYSSNSGLLDLSKAFAGKKGNWTLSYAYAGVKYYAPKNMTVTLLMDSFFPFRLFVNGKQLIYKQMNVIDCPERMRTKAFLKKGWNTIVFKTCQNQDISYQFHWGIYLKIVPDVHEIALRLPAIWKFRKDPRNNGLKQGWNKAVFNDSKWMNIRVPGCWENTKAGRYDGYAWYRTSFIVPKSKAGKALRIVFNGVDESAWVYLNGKYVGERTAKSTRKKIADFWNKPFAITIKPKAGKNILAVKVHDSTGAGGIYKTVTVYKK